MLYTILDVTNLTETRSALGYRCTSCFVWRWAVLLLCNIGFTLLFGISGSDSCSQGYRTKGCQIAKLEDVGKRI